MTQLRSVQNSIVREILRHSWDNSLQTLFFLVADFQITMATDAYCLEEVLAIADAHPFYNSTISYPPNAETIEALRGSKVGQTDQPGLKSRSLLSKKDLYVLKRNIEGVSEV